MALLLHRKEGESVTTVNKVRVSVAEKELTGFLIGLMPRTLQEVLAMFQGWQAGIPEEYRTTTECVFTAGDGRYEGDETTVYVSIYYMRPETDEERLEREKKAELEAMNLRLRDRLRDRQILAEAEFSDRWDRADDCD